MTATTGPAGGSASAAPDDKWYALTSDEVAGRLKVDPARGLSAAEVSQRLKTFGPNALAEAKPVPAWQRFLKQYKEYMRSCSSERRSSAS